MLPVEFKFVPTEDFSWEREYEDGSKVLMGNYYTGHVYNCSRQPMHDALRDKCVDWQEQGMIEIIGLKPGQSFKVVKVGE